MAVNLKRRRFTVDEYYRMAEADILGEDDRVELLDGEIVEMLPIGPGHASYVDRLTELFIPRFSDVAMVRVQNPVHLDQWSEPQPDLALLRRKPDYYASGHPTPTDVLLVVEIAQTSVEPDRKGKVPLYARHGIQEVWLVELQQGRITVYRDPTPDGYRIARPVRRGQEIAPIAFPDRPIPVADILPG